jgi:XTP/dITP diphosphohydrolase
VEVDPENTSHIRLAFATNNKHKLTEIRYALPGHIDLLSLDDLGIDVEIPEDQDTLEGNAAQKAFFIYNQTGIDCIADDTGLMIPSLNDEPGVYSARYAGKGCTFDDNMDLVLRRMQGIIDRRACFRTVIALVEHGKLQLFKGEVWGFITHEKSGLNGFGYDPIFRPDGFEQTFALMSPAEKNSISHRARALKALLSYFSNRIP